MITFDTATLNALSADQIHFGILGELDFASGLQNLWAGPAGHVLQWDSREWIALEDIGQIDKIAESQGMTDARTSVSLRLNSESFDVVEVEDSRGRRATIYALIFSDDGVPLGARSFRTRMGKTVINATASTDEDGRRVVNESISLELISGLAKGRQKQFQRLTYEAGLRIDPADHGLEFVSDPDAANIGLTRRRGVDRPRPRDRQYL